MTETLGAVLVAEIGSLMTRVTLIDRVDGESRMVGHAETLSSIEAPYQNALYGVLEATAQLSELTGRQLMREGQLIMPQSSERDGVSHLVAVTSAAGSLSLVITAIASDVSARSATQAARATYTALLQTVTLDDAADQAANGASDSWIERQVEGLLALRPDAVLIAGGLEHGAVDAVNRLANIVGLTAVSTGVDASGQQRQEVTARPVIYAGNSGAREQVIAALSDRAELFIVDNLRPALDRAKLDPTRQELARLYEKLVLPRLPGIAGLRRLSPRQPVRTVCEAQGLMTRFLAERTGRRVLTIDVGASASAVFLAAPGSYQHAVLGTTGVSYGLTDLLTAGGPGAIARWLPFPIDDQALVERLLNRALRPQALPASREDLYLDHALAREALRAAYRALQDEAPAAEFDWLVAGGGVLANAPQLGLALLTILDALEPRGAEAHPIFDVYLDSLSLMPVAGALAFVDPDVAVTVTDRDLLRNTPLASVVVPVGDGRPGEVAVEVELSVVGGGSERRSVRHGEIARLQLSPGRYGRMTLRPAGGVRIGGAAPGEVVSSEGGDVAGSALGVVIDARGRPLALPDDGERRRARIWEWLLALGVERGASPYAPLAPLAEQDAPAEPVAEAPAASPESDPRPAQPMLVLPAESPAPLVAATDEAAATPSSKRISLDELRAEEPPPPTPPAPGLDSELDALRQTVEEPKRRGLFGRKK